MTNSCVSLVQLPQKTQHPLTPLYRGEEKCAPEHYWGPGVRAHYLIHYVIDGKGVFYCGPHKYTLRKGQIFVVYPDTIVKYQADKTDPWHYTWVSFYGDEAKLILKEAGITAANPVLTLQNGDEILEVLRSMPGVRGADLQSNLHFSARLYDFLSLLLHNAKPAQRCENEYYTAAKRYIKAHYAAEITVDGVAEQIGISRKYLFAIFKNVLGISPKEYIVGYRMKQAKEFLANPELPIGSIAYSVGYKDPLTFSKMFKQREGVSPTEYRETVIAKLQMNGNPQGDR